MEATQAVKRENVLRVLSEVPRLPVSQTILQGMQEELRNRENANINRVSDLIKQDPSISSRVLRMANSPYYGVAQTVSTVRHAIVIIGLDELMRFLLVDSLRMTIPDVGDERIFSYEAFWRHSIACALAAQTLGKLAGSQEAAPAECYLAGLFHDVGKTVLAKYFPDAYEQCATRAKEEGLHLHKVELEMFGIDHAEIGSELAQSWRLPPAMRYAIAGHHASVETPDAYSYMGQMVMLADRLALLAGMGAMTCSIPARLDAEPLASFVKNVLNFSEVRIADTLATKVREEMDKLSIQAQGEEDGEEDEAEATAKADAAEAKRAEHAKELSEVKIRHSPQEDPSTWNRFKKWIGV